MRKPPCGHDDHLRSARAELQGIGEVLAGTEQSVMRGPVDALHAVPPQRDRPGPAMRSMSASLPRATATPSRCSNALHALIVQLRDALAAHRRDARARIVDRVAAVADFAAIASQRAASRSPFVPAASSARRINALSTAASPCSARGCPGRRCSTARSFAKRPPPDSPRRPARRSASASRLRSHRRSARSTLSGKPARWHRWARRCARPRRRDGHCAARRCRRPAVARNVSPRPAAQPARAADPCARRRRPAPAEQAPGRAGMAESASS